MMAEQASKKPVVRFAPSPTGRIHIGNARTALFNWLHAKRHDGVFILRYDDTDRARSTDEFAQGIAVDLRWLGIVPDQTVKQSERFARYDAAAARLREMELLYPCYETEDELEYRRRRQLAQHRAPIYDRAALKLTQAERTQLEAEGRKPYWRFRLEPRTIAWEDGVRGHQTIDCASLSDPVLIRADGSYLYTLPSVVDDIDLGVTDIIRGEDHVTNTAVQIQLFEALGATAPHFSHHNLLTLPSGEGLSKRLGHLSLMSLRENGYEPGAVAALSVLIGTSHSVEPVADIAELLGKVDLSDISHSSAKFDPKELDGLNARTLHRLDYAQVAERLAALGVTNAQALWLAIRGNLEKLADALVWARVVDGDETYQVGDDERALVKQALALLPPEPWDETTWPQWTKAVQAASGIKGRALFHPLRMALTGREQGPELKALLPLMSRARAVRRLEAAS